MKRSNLWHSSCQADEGCIVYCSSQANVLIDSQNAKLFRITTATDKVHYVWRDSPDGYEYEFPAACRAFMEDFDMLDDDIFNIKNKQQIIPDKDVFCFGGYVYYLRHTANDNLVIRRICSYSSQEIAEAIVADDFPDEVAESVYLVNFYQLENRGRKYTLTCWGVVLENGILYIPVFDEDRHFMEEVPIGAFLKEEIPVGTILTVRKMYYQVAEDDHGKLYLNRARNVFLLNKNIKTRTEAPARIIKVSFNKKSNGE